MGKRIYFAAPIHKEADFKHNELLIASLREQGFDVWAPQEVGIASDIAKAEGITRDIARERILHYDLSAMKNCDICLAFIDRDEGWSDGQLWEMGWFTGKNKCVVIYNPRNIPLTLMSEFTCDFMLREPNFLRLVEILNHV